MKILLQGTLIILILTAASCSTVKPDRTYNISRGEEFVVRLKANPSTGYQWNIQEGLKDSGLSLIEESYEPKPNPTDKPLLGAGGIKSWRFRAERKGKNTLTFVYQRPGEKKSEQTKHFRVLVK